MHQYFQTLGNPRLSQVRGSSSSPLGRPDSHNDRTMELLRILLLIHEYSSFDISPDSHPPWHSQSTFLSLWRQLELFRVRNPDDIWVDISSLKDTNSPTNETASSLISAMVWHCSVISLHRHFLAHASNWVAEQIAMSSENPLSISSLLSTSSSAFWKEHMNISLSSTATVVEICMQIMDYEGFFLVRCPPFALGSSLAYSENEAPFSGIYVFPMCHSYNMSYTFWVPSTRESPANSRGKFVGDYNCSRVLRSRKCLGTYNLPQRNPA